MGIMQTIVIMKLSSQNSGHSIRNQSSVGIVGKLATMLMIVGNSNLQMNISEIMTLVPIQVKNIL